MKTEKKTYLLKYPVHNGITFPIGSVVVPISGERYDNFKVVSGKYKGKKGCVANGLDGWLIENTETNRLKLQMFLNKKVYYEHKIKELNQKWIKIKAAAV